MILGTSAREQALIAELEPLAEADYLRALGVGYPAIMIIRQ